ncbi:ABC transporter ATP-binding protein [Natronobeatus ordinarius]|uniref:ABC transporter ATP-binding protein n=1 Tax=Natronobeatus ordinarius TaxID=2963433 RepID=UPI0020CED919|nr:ABC transporter ATP-binding protein [Natronobeatus ordinarius]
MALRNEIPKVTVEAVTNRYDTGESRVTALSDVSLEIPPGTFIGIVGPSGEGKSTLLRLLAGLEQPDTGRILVDGDPVDGPSADRTMVFQEYGLFPWLSVEENVAFGLRQQSVPQAQRTERVDKLLQQVGLTAVRAAYPKELSGGMKQRVAVARALAVNPSVLLLDEPFGSLDVTTREQLWETVLTQWEKTGMTVVLVTHELTEAVVLASQVLVMGDGSIRDRVPVDLERPRDPTDEGVVDRVQAVREHL